MYLMKMCDIGVPRVSDGSYDTRPYSRVITSQSLWCRFWSFASCICRGLDGESLWHHTSIECLAGFSLAEASQAWVPASFMWLRVAEATGAITICLTRLAGD